MEPPVKRRRQNPSALDDDDDDDDELFFQPQEVSARRDPGYKLSVKRANADHKLQATMAHIIEKYSHDFEGVGDEIDMETGEIVVNNGHLHSMRDEGDVGGGWVMDDDDDEGIRLEDLTDEQSDERELDAEVEDSEDEEDLIMRGRQVVPTSNAMVPTAGAKPRPQDRRLSSLFPTPYGGGFGGSPLGFGASPLAFGTSPFAFGNSPLALGPWGLPNGFGAPTWDHNGPQTNHLVPKNRLSLTAGGDRYEFPAQEGFKSIWASGSGYDDDWAARPVPTIRTGYRKHVPKYPTKPQTRKLLELAPSSRPDERNEEDDDDDDDEEAILTGRSSKNIAATSDLVIGDSDDDDDLVLFNSTASSTQVKSSPARIRGKVATRDKPRVSEDQNHVSKQQNPRKRKRRPPEQSTTESMMEKRQLVAAKVHKVPTEEVEENPGDRRRSGRARKQTEFLGKICWQEADGRRKTADTLAVELLRADPESRKDFKQIDNVTDEDIHSAVETTQEDSESDEEIVKENARVHVIPNSQDSGTPLTSSAPQEVQLKEISTQKAQSVEPLRFPGITSYNAAGSGSALSDDEAPMLLPKPNMSKSKTTLAEVESAQQVTDLSSGTELEPQRKSIASVSRHGEAQPLLASGQLKKRGRPRRSDTLHTPEATIESNVEELNLTSEGTIQTSKLDQRGPELPRKRGRPRKSDVLVAVQEGPSASEEAVSAVEPIREAVPEEATQVLALNEPKLEQPKPRGRPKKTENLPTPQTTHESHMANPQPESHEVTTVSRPIEPSPVLARKRGRPRKLEPIASVPEASSTAQTVVSTAGPAPETIHEAGSEQVDEIADSTEKLSSGNADKPSRLTRDVRWLQKWKEQNPKTTAAVDSEAAEMNVEVEVEQAEMPKKQLRTARSRETIKQSSGAPREFVESQGEHAKAASPAPAPAAESDSNDLSGNEPRGKPTPKSISKPSSTPKRTYLQETSPSRRSSQQLTPSKFKPQTPRHTTIRTSQAPSSRRSILSLLSDDEDDGKDELSRNIASLPQLQSSGAPTRQLWRSSALTTEIYRTPVKKRTRGSFSPGSMVKTPGGTARMCGADGYRCGRDFCFTCL